MRAMLLLAGLLLAAAPVRADEGLRVLYIGNSQTRINDLPRTVARLANADGRSIARRFVYGPGFRLEDHWERGRAARLIRSRRFTHVVLQAHSLDAASAPGELEELVGRFHREAVRAGATLVLMEPWPRRDTPAAERERIAARYRELARALDVPLAPAGRAWERARAALPAAPLYWPDGIHPTRRGTFLAACVLYSVLAGADPSSVDWRPARLDPAEAETLAAVARSASRL
jgi:hypothetical protein